MTISKIFLVLLLLFPLYTAIFLPLIPRRPRCMMVYTIGDIESVKIFLGLPQLQNQGQEESYLFTKRNTETE